MDGKHFHYNVDSELMMKYLAIHRMISLMYQHIHWITRGTAFYADHLLYERLYNKVSEEIDTVAEKAVGLSGEESVCPMQTTRLALSLMESLFPEFNIMCDPHELVECLIIMETEFINQSNSLYEKLEREDQMTLGLDDMISSLHSSHEENLYLLKQRYKSQSILERETEYRKDELKIDTDKEEDSEEEDSE